MELKDFITKRRDSYRKFHDSCDKAEEYYNLEFDVATVPGYTHVPRCSTARTAVDSASAQIDTASLQVYVPPRNSTPEASMNALLLSKFYRGCWRAIFEVDPIQLFKSLKHANLYGVSFRKFIYNNTLPSKKGESVEGYLERVREWREDNDRLFPFEIRVCHPKTVMPDKLWRDVIEESEMTVRDVRMLYPELDTKLDDDDMCKWTEFWTPKEYKYLCDDEIVSEGENPYGFIPYGEVDAGFGYLDDSGDPDKRYTSLLTPVYDAILTESQVMLEFEAGLRKNVFPQEWFRATDQSFDDAQFLKIKEEWDDGWGSKNYMPFGLTKDTYNPVSFPPEIGTLIAAKKDEVNTIMPRVAQGLEPQGAASGYKVAIVAGMARIKWGPVLLSLTRCMANENKKMARCVEIFDEFKNGMSVWGRIGTEPFGVEVKPKDINKHYVNEVKLSSIAPEEQSRLLHDGLSALQVGAISRLEWATRFAGMEDPEADRIQRIREKIEESPEVLAQLAREILETRATTIVGPQGEPLATVNPMGNRGNPPPPFLSGQTEKPYRPPMAGSPEEMDLVNRQVTRGFPTNDLTAPEGL